MGEYWCHSCNNVVHSLPNQVACNECRGEFIERLERPPGDQRRHNGDRIFHNIILRTIGPDNGIYNVDLDQIINRAPLMFQIQEGRNGGLADLVNMLQNALGLAFGGNFNGTFEDDTLNNLLDQLFRQYRPKPKVAKKSVVESLPIVELDSEKVKELLECSICKHDYEVGEKVKSLPCEHLYHTECIDTWFKTNNSCPICRFELEIEEEEPNNGNNENQENDTNNHENEDDDNYDANINNGEDDSGYNIIDSSNNHSGDDNNDDNGGRTGDSSKASTEIS